MPSQKHPHQEIPVSARKPERVIVQYHTKSARLEGNPSIKRYSDSVLNDIFSTSEEFAEKIYQKLSTDSYRYDGPMEDVANMILKEARESMPAYLQEDLELPVYDHDIISMAKKLNTMAQLLIPPNVDEVLKDRAQKVWSSVRFSETQNVNLSDRLQEKWYDEVEEGGMDCWTKDVYAPEKIRADVKEVIQEMIEQCDRVSVVQGALMDSCTDLAEHMVKDWKPESVNEFSSKNPPTYEDGVKAARAFLRFKKNHEAKLESQGPN